MQGLLITGTDTGVGKTFVSCRLLRRLRERGMRVGAYKPVCSGAVWDAAAGTWVWEDVRELSRALDDSFPKDLICPQRFQAAVSPPEAAQMEGRAVDGALVRDGKEAWRGRVEFLLIEGAGGWLSPLAERETIAEMAADWKFRVLIVAANRLGCINHTLLTLESVRARGLSVAGVLLNDVTPDMDESGTSNADWLRRLTNVPVWGPVPHIASQSNPSHESFDWDALALQVTS